MKRTLAVAVVAWVVAGGGIYAEPPKPAEHSFGTLPPANVPAPAFVPSPSEWHGGDCLPCPEEAACGPCGRIWAEADYLLWWMRGASLPPLVTTSPPGTPRSQAGVLGAPGTAVLFGGSDVNDELRSGARFTLGAWLDSCQRFGLEVGAFGLEKKGEDFNAFSSGSPILARPFLDATTGQPASELVAFPGLLSGSVAASASTNLVGADALLRANLCCDCNSRLDLVGGYRYLRLADHLAIRENLVTTAPLSPDFIVPGTSFALTDRFDTRNEFHGFDVGLRGEVCRGDWVLRGRADVAVGNNHEVVDVNGATTISVPGAPPPVTHLGGLLALSSNIGQRSKDRTVVIPQFGVQVGYQLTSHLRVYAGFTFLYWSEVVRAGDQIDLAVNPNLLPPVTPPVSGPLRPAPRFENTSFWAQGFDLGLEFRF
jgi:hypothetical protein